MFADKQKKGGKGQCQDPAKVAHKKVNVVQQCSYCNTRYDIMIDMKNKNYAFIDGNNLYLGAKSQGIELDYGKFRLYLRNKLGVNLAFLFIGYDPDNARLYAKLQSYGYILVFKPVVFYTEDGKRTMKGNVDAELVLHSSAIEYDNYDKAVLVTSDGDFACLIQYLDENGKLAKIVTPSNFYSSLFHPYTKYILPLSKISSKVSHNKSYKPKK